MKLQRREQILLGLLGLVAVAILISQAGSWIDALRGGDDLRVGGAGGGASVHLDGELVHLASIEPEIHDYTVERDPFRFGQPPRPEPTPTPPRPEPKPPPPPPTPKPEPVDTGPQPPPIEYAFLGSFGPVQRRIAVLTDGETLYNVRMGDEVEGVVRVRDIGYETVELEYIDFPEAPSVRLEVGS